MCNLPTEKNIYLFFFHNPSNKKNIYIFFFYNPPEKKNMYIFISYNLPWKKNIYLFFSYNPLGDMNTYLFSLFFTQRLQTDAHGIPVRIQVFVGSHRADRIPQMGDSIGRNLLEGHLFDEAIQVHATIGMGVSVGRERMVRPRGIIARALRRIRAHEYAPGVLHLFGKRLVIIGLDNQMFRRV